MADEGVEEEMHGEFMFGREIYILIVKANSQNTYIVFIKGGNNKDNCIIVSEKLPYICTELLRSILKFKYFFLPQVEMSGFQSTLSS